MRTIDRVRSRPGRSLLPRMGSLLMLGALVLLLYSYARETGNWKWLAPQAKPEQTVASTAAPEKMPEPTAKIAEAPAEEPSLGGETDQDVEQQHAVQEEFQALTDGALSMRREEMPAYWRMFYWTKNQTAKQMLARAKAVPLHDLLQHPDTQRGKLIKLELNLRRALSYEAPENELGIKNIYELWGWSEASKSWLYVGLTAELPPGMPLGAEIHERGTFVGYFLKVQGYHESNSKPNERPLSSPLLIGRWIWEPPVPVATTAEEPWWSWAIVGGLAVAVLIGCAWPWLRKPATAVRPTISPQTTNEVLGLFQEGAGDAEVENEETLEDHPHPLPLHGQRGSAELN